MAKLVKVPKGKSIDDLFPTKSAGAQSKYPWGEWFDGQVWMLEESVKAEDGTVTEARDYDVGTSFMPPKIKQAARRAYKVVRISRKGTDGNKLENGLLLVARDMTPEERIAEDEKRAEEKAEKEAAKAESNGINLADPAHQHESVA